MFLLSVLLLARVAEPADYATKPVDEKGPGSGSGLLNDWLRRASEAARPWDLGVQVRERYEMKEKAGSFPNRDFIAEGQDNSNEYLALRLKPHLGYHPAPWVQALVEGRDSRVWWDKREPSPDQDSFDLHQAFVVLGNAKAFPLVLKIGRQEMNYGDERFIGASDWSNTLRVFDTAKLRFENDTLWVDAFSGRVVVPYDGHFNVANDYDWFSGVYASTRKLIPWQETQLFFLARNVGAPAPNAIAPGLPGSPSTARDVYTVGGRIKSLPGKLHGWDYSTEIAGQFGSVSQGGARRDLESLAADATLGYTWTEAPGSPRFGAGYTYASGDSDPADGKYETFDLLYATNHRIYGVLDLFGLRNLHIPSVSFGVKPAKPISLRLDYLAFWLADKHDFLYPESGPGRAGNGYGRNPQFGREVGSELDLLASYSPATWAEFQFGYGHFFVGDYIQQSARSLPANGGAADADWIYVQAKFNF